MRFTPLRQRQPNGFWLRVHAFLNSLQNGFGYLDRATMIIGAIDDLPRSVGIVGASDQLLAHFNELGVHTPILPGPRPNLPRGSRAAAELFEALELTFLAEVHPELENQHPIVD